MPAGQPAKSLKSLPYLWNGLSHTEGGVHCFHFAGEEAVVQGRLAAGPGAADEPTEAEPLVGDDTKTVPSELMLPLLSQVTGHTEKGSL